MAYNIFTRNKIAFLQNQNTNISMFLYVPNDCTMNLTDSSTQKRGSCQNSNYMYGIQCVCVLDSCQWCRADKCQVSLFVENSFLFNFTENSRTLFRTTIWMMRHSNLYLIRLWLNQQRGKKWMISNWLNENNQFDRTVKWLRMRIDVQEF